MVDFIIVGQGIAGSCLAYHLIESGYSVVVIDDGWASSSTQVAAGLMTPITGKRLALSWEYPTLFPYACAFYTQLERRFKTHFLTLKPTFRYFTSPIEKSHWEMRSRHAQFQPYLVDSPLNPLDWIQYGDGFCMSQSGYLKTDPFLDAIKQYLIQHNAYLCRKFHYSQLHRSAQSLRYEGIEAKMIIYCEGYTIRHNPLFQSLPFQHVRGDIVTLRSKSMTQDIIFSGSKWCVPIGQSLFKFGATYDREHLDLMARPEGIKELKDAIAAFSQHPFEWIKIQTGVRPATQDVMPYMGIHPEYPDSAVFGGFSSKGILQAPYLAKLLTDHLSGHCLLHEELHVRRFFT